MYIRFVHSVILSILSAALCFGIELTPKQQEILKEADSYAAEASYYKASKLYKKLAEQCEADYEYAGSLYYKQAECLFFSGKTFRASEAYKQLVQKYKIVIPLDSVFERMRQIANNFEDGKGTFLGLEDSLAAISLYRFIINETPSPKASLNDRLELAHKLAKEKKYNEAVNEYQAILKFLPNEFQSRYELARLLESMALSGMDGDGRIGRAAAREAQACLDQHIATAEQEQELKILLLNCRETEAKRLLSLAEYYLLPRHLKQSAARRYLLDIQRDYPDTQAAVSASELIKTHFSDSNEKKDN